MKKLCFLCKHLDYDYSRNEFYCNLGIREKTDSGMLLKGAKCIHDDLLVDNFNEKTEEESKKMLYIQILVEKEKKENEALRNENSILKSRLLKIEGIKNEQ